MAEATADLRKFMLVGRDTCAKVRAVAGESNRNKQGPRGTKKGFGRVNSVRPVILVVAPFGWQNSFRLLASCH